MAVILGTRRTTRVRHDFAVDDLPFTPIGGTEPLYVLVVVRVDAEIGRPGSDDCGRDRGHVEILRREIREFNASVQAHGDGSLPEWLTEIVREQYEEELIDAALAKISDVDVDHALLCEAGQ